VEVDYLPLYDRRGLGLTTWSPLASGLLTGKYSLSGAIPADSRFGMESYKASPHPPPWVAAAPFLLQLPGWLSRGVMRLQTGRQTDRQTDKQTDRQTD
jgi:hypothetical protein